MSTEDRRQAQWPLWCWERRLPSHLWDDGICYVWTLLLAHKFHFLATRLAHATSPQTSAVFRNFVKEGQAWIQNTDTKLDVPLLNASQQTLWKFRRIRYELVEAAHDHVSPFRSRSNCQHTWPNTHSGTYVSLKVSLYAMYGSYISNNLYGNKSKFVHCSGDKGHLVATDFIWSMPLTGYVSCCQIW